MAIKLYYFALPGARPCNGPRRLHLSVPRLALVFCCRRAAALADQAYHFAHDVMQPLYDTFKIKVGGDEDVIMCMI